MKKQIIHPSILPLDAYPKHSAGGGIEGLIFAS
jgi:hypothetical protein